MLVCFDWVKGSGFRFCFGYLIFYSARRTVLLLQLKVHSTPLLVRLPTSLIMDIPDMLLRWTPDPVIVMSGGKRDYIRVLLYSYYTTITGWGGPPNTTM